MSKIYNMVFISPFGPIGVKSSNEVITELRFIQKIKQIKPTNSFFKEVYRQLELYFNRKLKKFDIPYILSGTVYQQSILKEVVKIKYGCTKTYSELAFKKKTHPRPVGNACRNNPIQLLIPCHRVVAINNIGGFSGEGLKKNGNMIFVKKNLLNIEKIKI